DAGELRLPDAKSGPRAVQPPPPAVRLLEDAKLEDVRIHDLRHSFASRALALGETLPVIGKLLGHNDIETTARYAHLAQDSIHEAAELLFGAWIARRSAR
ncbi:MAG: tyrosine-type recombinase/integrase, partial [Rhodospirillales bacterium]|nr:tyrosine-type recombinase/integrase [Rhodospirillales bacterium]